MSNTDLIALGAVIVSVLALIVSLAAALYTRSQAQTAMKEYKQEHEAIFALERGRYASISSTVSKTRVGGAAALILRNRGNSAAFNVQAKVGDLTRFAAPPSEMKPGAQHYLSVLPKGPGAVKVTVTWQTADGKKRKDKLKLTLS